MNKEEIIMASSIRNIIVEIHTKSDSYGNILALC